MLCFSCDSQQEEVDVTVKPYFVNQEWAYGQWVNENESYFIAHGFISFDSPNEVYVYAPENSTVVEENSTTIKVKSTKGDLTIIRLSPSKININNKTYNYEGN